MRIARDKSRMSHLVLVITLVSLVPSVHAESMLFAFIPDESEFVLSGGIGGVIVRSSIEGSLGLDVNFDENVASFVDVDATVGEQGPSLDALLHMTGATGTVVGAASLTFTSMDDQGLIVLLDVSLMPSSLTLVGGNVLQCCDFFSYQIDAVAELVPDITCDFDGDDVCNTADIDLMYATGDLVAGLPVTPADAVFDLNADDVLDTLDIDRWLLSAATENGFDAPYLKGDANLDGIVDMTDLNALALNWQGTEKVWSEGEFTGEGTANAADLNLLGINWWQSIPSAAVAKSVPEPSSIILLGVVAVFGFSIRRKY